MLWTYKMDADKKKKCHLLSAIFMRYTVDSRHIHIFAFHMHMHLIVRSPFLYFPSSFFIDATFQRCTRRMHTFCMKKKINSSRWHLIDHCCVFSSLSITSKMENFVSLWSRMHLGHTLWKPHIHTQTHTERVNICDVLNEFIVVFDKAKANMCVFFSCSSLFSQFIILIIIRATEAYTIHSR